MNLFSKRFRVGAFLVCTMLIAPQLWAQSSGTVIDMSDANPPSSGTGWTYTNDVYTVLSGANVTIIGDNSQPAASTRCIVVDLGAAVTITFDNVSIDAGTNCPFLLRAGSVVNLFLESGSTNTLSSGTLAGIGTTNAELIIDGEGTLIVTGGFASAGIGGSLFGDNGTTIIKGGIVTATGGYNSGAGIGGGFAGDGGTIIISGGTVTAIGGLGAAGIGGGESCSYAGDILIYGENSTVTAIGGGGGAEDIGRGNSGTAGIYFVALPQGNLQNASGNIGNTVQFFSTPSSASGIVTMTLPAPFDAAPFETGGTYDFLNGLASSKYFSVFTNLGNNDIIFELSGYNPAPYWTTGNNLNIANTEIEFYLPFAGITRQPQGISVTYGNITECIDFDAYIYPEWQSYTTQWYSGCSKTNGSSMGSSGDEQIFCIPTNLAVGNHCYFAIVTSDEGAEDTTDVIVVTVDPEPQKFCGGDGSQGDPYQICNAEQLDSVRYFLNDHFILNNDIDIDAYSRTKWGSSGWLPIGSNSGSFQGSFNGDCHTITGLWIDRNTKDSVGLFGYTNNNAIIENLGIVNCDVIGRAFIGGLVGFNVNSTINNCYVTGKVTGYTGTLGGLVGQNNNAVISNCYATGTVVGENSSSNGGLVGANNNNAVIANCYAAGIVKGAQYVGGLVGYNRSIIKDCVAANDTAIAIAYTSDAHRMVGINNNGAVNNCYANENMVLSHSNITDGSDEDGIGKDMITLKSLAFYTTAGNWNGGVWDIAAIANPSATWRICDGGSLPYSQCQPEQTCVFTLTLEADPIDGGNPTGGGNFPNNTPITVHANPEADYFFINWTKGGVEVSTNESYSFTLTENVHLVANYGKYASDSIVFGWLGRYSNCLAFNATNGSDFDVNWGDSEIESYRGTGKNQTIYHAYTVETSYTVILNGENGCNFTTLHLAGLQLTALDLRATANLRILYCENNQLSTLYLPNGDGLTFIQCFNNSLQLSDLYAISEKISNANNKRLGMQKLEKQILAGNTLDLSSQATFGGEETVFTIDGCSSCSVSGGVITFPSAGTYTVTMTNAAIVSHPNYPAQVVVDIVVE